MRCSVVIPVFNEESTVEIIHNRIKATGIADEIIYVNDGSTDKTTEILQTLADDPVVKVIHSKQNRGKGSALIDGINATNGDIIILQDADLEYDPAEYPKLISPLQEGSTDIVFGARFMERTWKAFYLPHYIANRILTTLTNILFGSNLNDMETGYKVFRKNIFGDLNIQAKRFEFEPEFTTKALLKGYTIVDVPIQFDPRKYNQGKKIKFKDAFIAVQTLLRIRFSKNPF